MEKIDKAKDQEKYTKKYCGRKWDKNQNQEQLKMRNWKGKNTKNSAKEM